jgi:hypothetical protein
MTASNTHNVLTGFVLLVLLAGGLACARTYDRAQLEGTWDCTTPWTWDREDGASVPCSAEVHVTCREGKFSATSVISLGDAQWDETSAGSCLVDGEELYGTRSSVQTTPRNDDARQFERDRLGGRGLSETFGEPMKYRARIVSLTETHLVHINEEGRTTTCRRP